MRAAKGFTLLEALIAMAAAAILLVVAIPAWSNAKAATDAARVRAHLATSMLNAERHAATTETEVVMCPASSVDKCSGTTNWDMGWMVFADINGNRTPDPNETRLESSTPLPQNVHVRSTAGRTRLVFQPNGGDAGSNITFTLCDSRGPGSATTLVLSNSGNLRAGQPTSAAANSCVYGAP